MIKFAHITIIFLLLLMTTNLNEQELTTVPNVDLNKYAGTWFEIASIPQGFQKGCECTKAIYTPTDKGYISIENSCKRNGKNTHIKGKAFVVKNSGNAKLKVQFFWPFKGKYWIIELADDYSYAVVGHPNKKYLWILSRNKTMNNSLYELLILNIKEKGFDISAIKLTKQL